MSDTLRLSLEQEIALLRAVLASHIEEERCLREGDEPSWRKVMEQRFFLLEGLKECRQNRNPREAPGEELVYLLEQFFCLADKITEQSQRNLFLTANPPLAKSLINPYTPKKQGASPMTTVMDPP